MEDKERTPTPMEILEGNIQLLEPKSPLPNLIRLPGLGVEIHRLMSLSFYLSRAVFDKISACFPRTFWVSTPVFRICWAVPRRALGKKQQYLIGRRRLGKGDSLGTPRGFEIERGRSCKVLKVVTVSTFGSIHRG